jgi:hypothetical protein
MKYYKFTRAERYGTHRTSYQYPTPGEWTEPVKPVLCEAGYHVCTAEHLLLWRDECLWEVEVKGESVHGNDKSAFEQIRLVRQIEAWNPKVLRIYAADEAEDVLHLFEAKYPDDNRPRLAIQAARDYAKGLIFSEQLFEAARAADLAADRVAADASAADYAARSAAAAAAASAADAYFSPRAARAAARSAAYAAAGAADYDAGAYAAAYATERKQALSKYNKWLLERLGIEE